MKNLRIHNKVITAGNMNYLQRQQQLQHGIEEHYRELHIPPGNPTQKPYWGQPEQTGEPIPTVAGNYEIPRGWPREPIFNPPGGPPGPPIQFGEPTTNDNVTAGYGYLPNSLEERDLYFYHPDHLGSTSIITDKAGVATQFVCYMPFGEAFVDEHVSRKEMPYKFNGKEQDEETGLYYYGARYYDAGIGVWYGVDVLGEKHPNIGGYVYCSNNPIIRVDPTGMTDYFNLNGKMVKHVEDGSTAKMMVITSSGNAKKVDAAISSGYFINAPTSAIVAQMEATYQKTEASYGNEHGFTVNNDNSMSGIVSGTQNGVTLDVNSNTAYQVHSHGLQQDQYGQILDSGKPEPSSDVDMPNATSMIEIVLGYKEKTNGGTGSSNTIGSSKKTSNDFNKKIGFYNKDGSLTGENGFGFDSFKNAVKKIENYKAPEEK
jgi:RHS repeat-associated protein